MMDFDYASVSDALQPVPRGTHGFAGLLADLARVGPEEAPALLRRALRGILEAYGFSHAHLLWHDPEAERQSGVPTLAGFSFSATGGEAPLPPVPASRFGEVFDRGQSVFLRDPGVALGGYWREVTQGAAILLLPMVARRRIAGLIGFDMIHPRNAIAPGDRVALQFVADAIAGLLPWLRPDASVAPRTGAAAPATVELAGDPAPPAATSHPAPFDLGVVVELMTNLVAVVDPAQRVVWVNRAFEKQTGWRLEEIRGRLLAEVTRSADSDPATVAAVRAAIAANAEFNGEILNQDRDGRPYWINFNIHPLRDAAGALVGYCSIETVVTERHRLERTLQAERDYLAQLIETSISGIIAFDGEGRVTHSNAEAARILDLDRDQMIGRAFNDHDWRIETLEGADFPAEDRPIHRVLTAREEVRNVRYVMIWPSGRRRVVSVNASPIDHPLNPARIVCVFTDITEQVNSADAVRDAAETAQHLATHDSLTGLPNRGRFREILTEALTAAGNRDETVALAFVDIDNFKNINDSLGHEAGDRILKLAAQRMTATLRMRDIVARHAGDEFAILLTAPVTRDEAQAALDEVIAAMRQPFDLGGQTTYLTVSAGVTMFPEDAEDADMLLQNADMAMYRAKAAGRNRTAVFSARIRSEISRLIDVMQALRRGLSSDHFRLVLQPKFSLANPLVTTGAEALLRWHDPVLGDVGPDEFIPLAETAGLIRAIDLKVVRLLGDLLQRWRGQGIGVPVSFNISAQSLQGEGFARILLRRFEEYGIRPEEVIVEITETGLMDNIEMTRRNVTQLHEAGVQTALDDFGTGYSSLSYLQRLPIRELKIDRSFIANVGIGDAGSDAIVRAVVTMADALGMTTVAEGVEQEVQRKWLFEQGCDTGQGLLFGLAQEIETFEDRYLAHPPLRREFS